MGNINKAIATSVISREPKSGWLKSVLPITSIHAAANTMNMPTALRVFIGPRMKCRAFPKREGAPNIAGLEGMLVIIAILLRHQYGLGFAVVR
jgi:hypothetical protein